MDYERIRCDQRFDLLKPKVPGRTRGLHAARHRRKKRRAPRPIGKIQRMQNESAAGKVERNALEQVLRSPATHVKEARRTILKTRL